jgi:hypothetical protein
VYRLLIKYYLLIVGKKGDFEVVVVDRGVVVREVDGVVEVVDVVPVVVRVVVVGSAILEMLKGLRVDGGVCAMLDPFTKEEIEGFTTRYSPSSSSL